MSTLYNRPLIYKIWFLILIIIKINLILILMLILIVTTISYKLMVYCSWYSLKSTVNTVILHRWHLLSYLSILASTDTQHNPPHSSVWKFSELKILKPYVALISHLKVFFQRYIVNFRGINLTKFYQILLTF